MTRKPQYTFMCDMGLQFAIIRVNASSWDAAYKMVLAIPGVVNARLW